MTTADNALVIMTKAPQAGQSKTRLVPPLTFAEAAGLAHALLIDQLDNLSNFHGAARYIAFTPDSTAGYFAAFQRQGYTSFPQRGDSLGERMGDVFRRLFESGCRAVVLIGSDLPAVPVKTFDQAYAALETAEVDIVLGPSDDGGYYLVGMKRPILEMFERITWSRADVLRSTTEKLDALGLKYKLLCAGYDIDKIADLGRLWDELDTRGGVMNNTLTLLRQFRRRGII